MNHFCTCVTKIKIRDKHFTVDIMIDNNKNVEYHKPTFELQYVVTPRLTYTAYVGEIKLGKRIYTNICRLPIQDIQHAVELLFTDDEINVQSTTISTEYENAIVCFSFEHLADDNLEVTCDVYVA